MSRISDNLVTPPAWRYLYRQHVFATRPRLQHRSDIVGERAFGLGIMSETWLQHLIAYRLAIHIEFIYTQCCGHPNGFGYFHFVLYSRDKPVGTVCSTPVAWFPDNTLYHRGIYHRYPLRSIPCRVIQRFGHAILLFLFNTACQRQQGSHQDKTQCFQVFHSVLSFILSLSKQ